MSLHGRTIPGFACARGSAARLKANNLVDDLTPPWEAAPVGHSEGAARETAQWIDDEASHTTPLTNRSPSDGLRLSADWSRLRRSLMNYLVHLLGDLQ